MWVSHIEDVKPLYMFDQRFPFKSSTAKIIQLYDHVMIFQLLVPEPVQAGSWCKVGCAGWTAVY